MKTNLNMHLSMHQNRHKTTKTDKNLSLKTLPYTLHRGYTNSSYGHTNVVILPFIWMFNLTISNLNTFDTTHHDRQEGKQLRPARRSSSCCCYIYMYPCSNYKDPHSSVLKREKQRECLAWYKENH